jgi:peptidoglycan/LPS O-acetylase OafA/YrhL
MVAAATTIDGTTSARPYAPSLDGVRAFCILLTVMNHVETLPFRTNGGIGVDIFFALSGWLITWLLLDERRRTGVFDLSAFYIRRFFRIVPLYALTIVLYIIAAYALKLRGNVVTWAETMTSLPYLVTFMPELRTAAGISFGHAWTLGIEEKFYLVWPAVYYTTRCRPVLALCLALLLALAATVAWNFNGFFLRGYWGLGCGAAMAIFVTRSSRLSALFSNARIALPAIATIAALYVASLTFCEKAVGWNMGVSFCGAFLVASLWSNTGQRTAKFLSRPPLVWAGKLTYALYLIHVLVLNAFREVGVTSPWLLLVLTYAGSLAFAWALHVGIERPLIRYGRSLVRAKALAQGGLAH